MQCSRYFMLILTLLMATPGLQAMQAFPLTTMSIVKAHTVFGTLRKYLVIQASSNYQLAKADPHYFTKLLEREEFKPAVDTLHPEKRVGVHQLAESLQHAIHANPANPSAVGAAYTKLFNYLTNTCSKDLQSRSYLLRQVEKGQLSFASIDDFNTYQKNHDQAHDREKQARKAARIIPGKNRTPGAVDSHNRRDTQPESDGSEESEEALNDSDNNNEDNANQGFWRGIFSWIMRNKLKSAAIGVGAGLTIYGVLAKIMSWWPFSDTPADQQKQVGSVVYHV